MTVEARIADPAHPEHDDCTLERPHVRYRDSVVEGASEFDAIGRLDSTYASFLGYDVQRLQDDFDSFVHDLSRLADESRIRQAGYRDCVYWLIDGDEYVGQASIRPDLGTPYLITYGGHVGYSIRPSRRRQGYGRRILALALQRCVEEQIDRVLVTCDEDNLPSRRIIEANGGLFESGLLMDDIVANAEGRGGEQVRKLRYWFEPRIGVIDAQQHGLVLPDYSGGSIVNVAASVLEAFGLNAPSPGLAASRLPADGVRGPGGTVLLVLDALGHAQLATAIDAGVVPRLAQLTDTAHGGLQQLTSIFPSTTTAALNSLATGCTPAQHGILGHMLWFDELDSIVNMLTMRPIGVDEPIDEEWLRRVPTIYRRLAAAGIPSTAITDESFEHTPFTNLLVDGATFAGYSGLSQIPFQLEQALRANDGRPAFYSLYWPLIDTLAHSHGPDLPESHSAASRLEMEFIDLMIDKVATLCARHRCTLVIVADHGQTDLDPDRAILVGETFGDLPLPHTPAGARRVPFLRGVDADAVNGAVGAGAPTAVSSNDAIDAGWFGTTVSADLAPRVGDTIVLASEGVQYMYDYGGGTHTQLGSHSGLTPYEMLVPLIILPA